MFVLTTAATKCKQRSSRRTNLMHANTAYVSRDIYTYRYVCVFVYVCAVSVMARNWCSRRFYNLKGAGVLDYHCGLLLCREHFGCLTFCRSSPVSVSADA